MAAPDKLKIPFLTAGSMSRYEDKRERYRVVFWAWNALVYILAGVGLVYLLSYVKLLIPRWVV